MAGRAARRIAILDDYQDVARSYADWDSLGAEVTAFTEHHGLVFGAILLALVLGLRKGLLDFAVEAWRGRQAQTCCTAESAARGAGVAAASSTSSTESFSLARSAAFSALCTGFAAADVLFFLNQWCGMRAAQKRKKNRAMLNAQYAAMMPMSRKRFADDSSMPLRALLRQYRAPSSPFSRLPTHARKSRPIILLSTLVIRIVCGPGSSA